MKILQKPGHEEQLLVSASNGAASVKWGYSGAPLFTFYGVALRKFLSVYGCWLWSLLTDGSDDEQ